MGNDIKLRVGTGYDVHRLVPHRPLVLGGVTIPFEKGTLGHSDGDALTHAIADAVLGALGLGDIGQHFPDTDPEIEGIYSIDILRHVTELVHEKGWFVGNVDATIVMQQPKLKPFLDDMCQHLAEAMMVDRSQVSVKATTTEKLGITGRGEAVAAQAVCLLQREPDRG